MLWGFISVWTKRPVICIACELVTECGKWCRMFRRWNLSRVVLSWFAFMWQFVIIFLFFCIILNCTMQKRYWCCGNAASVSPISSVWIVIRTEHSINYCWHSWKFYCTSIDTHCNVQIDIIWLQCCFRVNYLYKIGGLLCLLFILFCLLWQSSWIHF